jgi:uncharacterized integral membrane protein (TIGR00697 family)
VKITPLFLAIAMLFVATLIASNIMAVKIIEISGRLLPAAIIIFPISYIIGDILTEVYGFRHARIVIWLGFVVNALAVMAFYLGGLLPPASVWDGQSSYELILGYTPRLLLASFSAYLVGEFTNSLILAKMKVATRGRWLWSRTIGSTIVGQALDSVVFIVLAFAGTLPSQLVIEIVLTQWTVKVLYETAATPVTYGVVAWLKKREGVDHYDSGISFNPLALSR